MPARPLFRRAARSHAPRGGRHRAAPPRRRGPALLTAAAVLVGFVSPQVFTATAAQAATTALSTFSKAGTDLTHASTATTTTHGSAQPGDTIKWALSYTNNSTSTANVSVTDPITGGQTYVANSLQVPPSFTGSVAGNTVTATGSVVSGTVANQSPNFSTSAVTFNSPGGDGYSVEGYKGSIYTVFHHNPSATVVYCATLGGAVCPGWPGFSTYVNPTAGTPIGTGAAGVYTSSYVNGSFISNGRLYWPVGQNDPAGDPFGFQCLDLNALTSCGYNQFGTTKVAGYPLAGDGIAAADGNYYYVDLNGDLNCVTSTTTSCGAASITAGLPMGTVGAPELGTYGRYVYVTYIDAAGTGQHLSCYDTSTHAVCPGFPIAVGTPSLLTSEVFPVVSATGAFLGGCSVWNSACYSPTGAALPDPWSQTGYSFAPGAGQPFGTGVLVGTRYYTGYTNQVNCYDFAQPLVGGKVQPCANFTTNPPDLRSYTVRPLANLPGCMASDGDGAQISVFNAATGGACASASQTVKLSPASYYCDGKPGHATAWGAVSLPGLNGSQYYGATLSLTDANGNPVPGWTDVAFPTTGPQTIDISSIPLSGNTASLTATVNMAAVTDPAAVNASQVKMSWVGDGVQICYETVVPPVPCQQSATITDDANAVSTINATTTDAPGNDSGTVTFDVAPTAAQCMLHLTKTGSPDPARPGDTVTYTITVQNTGTQDYVAANPASFTDDISNVLGDASFDFGSLTASAGGATYNPTTKVISWSGPLAAGATSTISYTVTVDSPDTGGHLMVNQVVTPPGVPSNCAATSTDPDCSATVAVQSFRVVKTTTATSVTPGGTVDYTVTVTNTGTVAYSAGSPASFTDDLTKLLDDASYNADAAATAGAVSYAAPTLSWSGPLPVGATVTVTYSVTAHDPDTGDHRLDNTVVTPAGSGGNCPTGSADPSCSADLPSKSFQVVKTASETTANAGDTVTYTLTVTNTGQAAYTAAGPASLSDDLTGVLDDAAYNNDASASAGTVSYAAPRLAWSGPLAIGASVTITYSVTVNSPDKGDHELANTVTTPNGSGGNCSSASTDPNCKTLTPVRSYTVAKAASETDAQPGDTVLYTLTVTNTGKADYTAASPAGVADNLSKVIDDATYDNDAAASGGTVGYTAPTLSWSGPLAVGATVTITYSVTVNNPDTGDGLLTNAADPTGPGGGCADGSVPPCAAVNVPVASYTVTKTASPSGPVHPGDTVTYTITVHNPSQGGYTAAKPASFSDDLTAVLDDATYNNDAAASAGTASYKAPTVSWSGPLAAGATVTVTYSVTVNDPDTGDHTLTNAADPTGPGGGCSNGSAPPCAPVVTLVQSFEVAKTASTAGPLHPGDTVTYTITVTNTGQVAYTAGDPAALTDNLAAVLDDAAYNNDAAATAGSVSYSAPTLSWSGPLAIGATATITYTVTVNVNDTGNHTLANTVVTPPGSGGNCPSGSIAAVCSVTLPVQSFSVVKTADKTKVTPGEKVTYTVTVTNTGTVDYSAAAPASFTDDLSGVLDDATYDNDAAASAGAASYTAPTLSWSGPLAVGATVTVTYSVTVNSPDHGDQKLGNTVVTPTGSGGDCPSGSTNPQCSANVPGDRLQVKKTASTATATPGQKVTYTITVTNSGQTDFTAADPATLTDDLSGVLDDATYNGDASTGASVKGTTLTWSGPLAIGATATITYSVTVNRPDTGDKLLKNVVTLPPGENSNCSSGSTDPDCATTTPVRAYTVKKTVSSSQAKPGDTLTYTITVTNTGQVAFTTASAASFVDDMTQVLDDASYNNDAHASSGSTSYSAPKLTWTGPLPIAGMVTVTYTVTVNNPDNGDGSLRNVVTTPADPSGTGAGNCPAGSGDPDCLATSSIQAGTTPASTGNDSQLQLLLAALLLAAGGALAVAGRRRRRPTV